MDIFFGSSGSSKSYKTENYSKHLQGGTLVTKLHTLKKRKRQQKFACKECEYSAPNIRELNNHHKTVHNAVHCPICDKPRSTPAFLRRHSYEHQEFKNSCAQCSQGFNFKRELVTHTAVHRTATTFPCMAKKCGKVFKTSGELNKHVKVHSGNLWKCDSPNCDYSDHDRRSLTAHKESDT